MDYVTAYQKGGTDAMGNVLDKKDEKSRAQEYRTLLANSPYLVEYVKEFNDYLVAYPNGKLAGAEDVIYWAKDTFGLKPVVSAYHMTRVQGPPGRSALEQAARGDALLQREPRDHGCRPRRRRQGPLPPEPLPDADRSSDGHAVGHAHGQGPKWGRDRSESEPGHGPHRLGQRALTCSPTPFSTGARSG